MHTMFPAPALTCALALVHSGPEYSLASHIVAAAAFVVIDDTVGTRFELRTAIIPPSLSRREAIAHVAKLAPNCATVLVGPPRLPRGRLGVPLPLLTSKAEAPLPESAGDWLAVRDHVELDTLLLSLAHASWLVSVGAPGVRYAASAIGHLSAFVRRRPDHALANEIKRYQNHLEADIAKNYAAAA